MGIINVDLRITAQIPPDVGENWVIGWQVAVLNYVHSLISTDSYYLIMLWYTFCGSSSHYICTVSYVAINCHVLSILPFTTCLIALELCKFGRRSFSSQVSRVWNNLSVHLRNSSSVNSFKVTSETYLCIRTTGVPYFRFALFLTSSELQIELLISSLH